MYSIIWYFIFIHCFSSCTFYKILKRINVWKTAKFNLQIHFGHQFAKQSLLLIRYHSNGTMTFLKNFWHIKPWEHIVWLITCDCYLQVSAVDGQVTLRGSSGVAAAMGFYYYLKQYCGCHTSWAGSQWALPQPLPDTQGTVTVTTNDR